MFPSTSIWLFVYILISIAHNHRSASRSFNYCAAHDNLLTEPQSDTENLQIRCNPTDPSHTTSSPPIVKTCTEGGPHTDGGRDRINKGVNEMEKGEAGTAGRWRFRSRNIWKEALKAWPERQIPGQLMEKEREEEGVKWESLPVNLCNVAPV